VEAEQALTPELQFLMSSILADSATPILLGGNGCEGGGLPADEAVSFPLPSGSLSTGCGLLTKRERQQRERTLQMVEQDLVMQQAAGVPMPYFAPFPLLIPFGWRPESGVSVKKATQPERANVKVFIGGLPATVTEEALYAHFAPFGSLVSAEILTDHETRRSRGFGYLEFKDSLPDGVLGNHKIEGRTCGTRLYDFQPAGYSGGYGGAHTQWDNNSGQQKRLWRKHYWKQQYRENQQWTETVHS